MTQTAYDYTGLPIGTQVEDGVIQKCPHCGKLGQARVEGKITFYNHRALLTHNPDQSVAIKYESCPEL